MRLVFPIMTTLLESPPLALPSPACTPTSDVTGRTDWRADIRSRKPLQYPLTEAQIATYHRDGFLVMPGLLADLAEGMDRAADALAADRELQIEGNLRYALREVEGETRINKIDPFVDLAPFWSRLVRDRRICDALASLYDGYEPRLFKDKLIYKPPHSPAHGLHQDYNWWQGFPESCISVSIPIDGSNRENGATCFYPGVHARGFLHKTPGELSGFDSEAIEGIDPVQPETAPGDVILFGCYAPHMATPNETNGFRRIIFLTYNDSRDGEFYQAHYDHFFDYRVKGMEPEKRARHFFL